MSLTLSHIIFSTIYRTLERMDIITYSYNGEDYDDQGYRDIHNLIYKQMEAERFSHIVRVAEIQSKCKYIFLTINPNPRITLKDFVSTCDKMMSKTWMTNYLYCYEQRGETPEECGKGYHFHAIIEKPTTKAYSHIVREMATSASKLCDTSEYHFYNLKNISDEEKERKIIYITGRKADPAKWAKQDMDIPFRLKNGLKSCYNIGII